MAQTDPNNFDAMVLWDYGFERASVLNSRGLPWDIDGVVLDAIEKGVFVPSDCCSVCPMAAEVSAGAKAFAGNDNNFQNGVCND